MTESEFIGYFRQVAAELKAVAHHEGTARRFCTLDDFISGAAKSLDTQNMVLAVGNEGGTLDGLGQGAGTESHECTAAVLRKCQAGNSAAIAEAYAAALPALRRVLGRMARDKRGGAGIMLGLKLESIQFRKIGPYADSLFGYEARFSINFKNIGEYAYKPEDWL